jgi:hypothetical protein
VKIGFASFCTFDEKQQKHCKNAGILPFGPKPATWEIRPAAKKHLFFTVKNTFMLFFYQEMSFSLASKKTL